MVVELPEFKHSDTGGVKPMSIEGRFGRQRARLSPEFTDADRAWRKQWLKDQVLAHDEPRFVPEHYYGTKNMFRRFYRAPLDAFERALLPRFGEAHAGFARRAVGKTLIAYCFGILSFYIIKYNENNWTKNGGWKLRVGEGVCLPCHEDYPRKIKDMKASDYDAYGFNTRSSHTNI